MRSLLKQALWDISPRLYDRVTRPDDGQTFSIGIYRGASPLTLANPSDVTNPVLSHRDVTDVPAAFVADPFMVRHGGGWNLFFEVLNKATRRGEIGLATSADARTWRYRGRVLREPFHLAFPCVFCDGDDAYLVPDSPSHGVRLYHARRFPHDWRIVGTLLAGGRYSDNSIFEYRDDWWMFTAWAPEARGAKTLRLYFADSPIGPWREHPASPLPVDEALARPAGRVVVQHGRPVRFTQHGYPHYGSEVRAIEIVELSRTTYVERPLSEHGSMLHGSGRGWNAGGMHHVDAHALDDGSWVACVDGWYANDARAPRS